MNKKGQAAMEFLMTYGWAILVVIAAIAALAYFGVLDPARLLPERCQSSAGMDCIDKASISTAGLTMALRNNQGFAINITDIDGYTAYSGTCVERVYVGSSTNVTITDGTLAQATVPNNEVFRVQVTGCTTSPAAGDKYDESLIVYYTNQETLLANQVRVDVRGRVA